MEGGSDGISPPPLPLSGEVGRHAKGQEEGHGGQVPAGHKVGVVAVPADGVARRDPKGFVVGQI